LKTELYLTCRANASVSSHFHHDFGTLPFARAERNRTLLVLWMNPSAAAVRISREAELAPAESPPPQQPC